MAKRTAKERVKRSPEELRRASLTVQYELVTLAQSHEFVQELGADQDSSARDKAFNNVLIHAFLLAARNILAFLYSYQPRVTDIIAEDFFDDPEEWKTKRPVPEPEMADGELVNLISKRLAHLTWDRADTSKPLWGPYKIIWNIVLVLESFLQLTEATNVHPQLWEDALVVKMRLEALAEMWGGISGEMAPVKEIIEFDDADYFDRNTSPQNG